MANDLYCISYVSIGKDIAYSPMLQQYLTESNAREKAQTYEHFHNCCSRRK